MKETVFVGFMWVVCVGMVCGTIGYAFHETTHQTCPVIVRPALSSSDN